MKTLYEWCKSNSLYLITLFLLAFIPLYPKLPLVDIRHTWVYVRIEDFIVLFVLLYFGTLIARKKITIATPLTLPIFIFWIIGAIATIHSILLIFPTIAHVYPNVALLSFIRRIEYMSLFFVAYVSVRDKRSSLYIAAALTATVLGVALYGIGQKYFGFYAYLTMNEEFAKGIPIQLSQLSRVSSTFSGHYDLAAYLVLMLPILVSMLFAVGNRLAKVAILATTLLGFFVLVMTVSRISVVALFISLGIVLLFQRKKLVLAALPIIVLLTMGLVSFSPSLFDRFGNTIKEIDVLVDATTGDPIGHAKEVPNTYFAGKTVTQQFSRSIRELFSSASPSAALVIPYTSLPSAVELLVEPNAPTGEDLPQGTGYINLSLSPVRRKLGNFYYEPKKRKESDADAYIINGAFLLKRVYAYDLSFTTRFQGEWPNTIAAFKRNILVGSGYGSVGLAVDNSYLRMLGEVGILGFGAYFLIFVVGGIWIRKSLGDIPSLSDRSFIVGFLSGVAGLLINAFFIDVFEASKVAFSLWLLTGIVFGILRFHERGVLDVLGACKRIATSKGAIVAALLVLTIFLYSSTTKNYFVGDDFTWFRWAAESGQSKVSSVIRYVAQADGFFYRPGAKTYYLLMYSLFWLNQSVYHFVSIILQFAVSVLVVILAHKILKNLLYSAAAGFLFLFISGTSEAIYWVSATGFLFTAFFSLLSLLSFISWQEKKKRFYAVATVVFFLLSLSFHELGIVTPLLYLLYRRIAGGSWNRLFLVPVPIYVFMRWIANSHWLSGDYSYNILKFPLNALGNAIGYFLYDLLGPVSAPLYQTARNVLRGNAVLAVFIFALALVCSVPIGKWLYRKIAMEDKKIVLFGLMFFLIALLPFLGLGNMSSRYGYFAAVGLVYLIIVALTKIHAVLQDSGREIARAGVILAASSFVLFQIVQIQQVQSDWYEAGEKSRRFIVAMQGAYEDYWATEPMELHLVNVPIRNGEAWIFPVGISDALWMLFRNQNIRVYSWPSSDAALNFVGITTPKKKIFEFTGDGMVTEIQSKPINQ